MRQSQPQGTDHWDRLARTMGGKVPDRVPISLWRHFPVVDQTAQGLAEATVAWQRRFDFDFVKFMPTGIYGVEDWGVRSDYAGDPWGVRRVLEYGVNRLADWEGLAVLDPGTGCLGRQVDALHRTARALDGEVPILQTVFSPLTTALKLAGEETLLAAIRLAPETLKAALAVIAETTDRFVAASVEAGAHGVFLATQCADASIMAPEDYRIFGTPFDRAVMAGAMAGTQFRLVHVHGVQAHLDLFLDYPANMLNWHDRLAGPSLAEIRDRFPGTVVGGINEEGAIIGPDAGAMRREVRAGWPDLTAPRTVISAGCVLPVAVREDVVEALVQEVGNASLQ